MTFCHNLKLVFLKGNGCQLKTGLVWMIHLQFFIVIYDTGYSSMKCINKSNDNHSLQVIYIYTGVI